MLRVDVRLYGIVTPWRFPGSVGLGDWLSGLPWLEEGGVCSVVCPIGAGDASLETAIHRAACAAHAGNGSLRVISVESGQHLGSPLEACLRAFDLNPSAGTLQVAKALARVLRTEPTLFVVRVVGVDRIEWWEMLNEFAEIYHKRHESSPFAVVNLGSTTAASTGPRFDFWHGSPEGIDLWGEGLGEGGRWASYLYCRTAWEAAGSLEVAKDLENRTRGLALGNDEALEQSFNEHAIQHLKEIELPAEAWTRLVASYGYRNRELGKDWEQPRPVDLWWSPPHSAGQRLAPWASRAALLQKNASGPSSWKLRNELICEPLSRDLFAICQQGEALARSRVFRSGMKSSPSAEANELLTRFQSDENRNSMYPRAHPARPVEAWAFASLGEVINAATDRLPEPFRNLLWLRNSVAHGHFVGWKHISTVTDLMRFA